MIAGEDLLSEKSDFCEIADFFSVEAIALVEMNNVERDRGFDLNSFWSKNKKQRVEVQSMLKQADEQVEKFWSVTENVFMSKMEVGGALDASNIPSVPFLDRLEAIVNEDAEAKALFCASEAGEFAIFGNSIDDECDFFFADEGRDGDDVSNNNITNINDSKKKFSQKLQCRARDVLVFELERAGFINTKTSQTIPQSPPRHKKTKSILKPQPWDALFFSIERVRELQKSAKVIDASPAESQEKEKKDVERERLKKINIVADNLISSLRDLDIIEACQLERLRKASKLTLSIPDGRVSKVIEDKFKNSRKVALVAFEKFCASISSSSQSSPLVITDEMLEKRFINTPTRNKENISNGSTPVNDVDTAEEKAKRHGTQAKKILSEWLYDNFYPTETRKRPVPTKTEKKALAIRTGLTQTQVTDWFVNARARLWKPRVEGIVRSVIDELKQRQ